mmetsp:Transcript_8321/g.27383  ORF Transcript_8321/g.27383 Transcript_8321/m.27383 type:complete len:254 (-) Transcript_8321:2156-2917(-)
MCCRDGGRFAGGLPSFQRKKVPSRRAKGHHAVDDWAFRLWQEHHRARARGSFGAPVREARPDARRRQRSDRTQPRSRVLARGPRRVRPPRRRDGVPLQRRRRDHARDARLPLPSRPRRGPQEAPRPGPRVHGGFYERALGNRPGPRPKGLVRKGRRRRAQGLHRRRRALRGAAPRGHRPAQLGALARRVRPRPARQAPRRRRAPRRLDGPVGAAAAAGFRRRLDRRPAHFDRQRGIRRPPRGGRAAHGAAHRH